MGIFKKSEGPKLTLEEWFVSELDSVVVQADESEVEEFATWIFDYIPLLVAHASRPTSPFLLKVKETVTGSGRKLLWRALSPVDCVKAILVAVETHAPNIQRIFLAQVERYKRERAQLSTLKLEAADGRTNVIDAEVVDKGSKLLEPVR